LSQPGSPQNGDLRFVDFAAGTRYAGIIINAHISYAFSNPVVGLMAKNIVKA